MTNNTSMLVAVVKEHLQRSEKEIDRVKLWHPGIVNQNEVGQSGLSFAIFAACASAVTSAEKICVAVLAHRGVVIPPSDADYQVRLLHALATTGYADVHAFDHYLKLRDQAKNPRDPNNANGDHTVCTELIFGTQRIES
jgi:hypothetical protein